MATMFPTRAMPKPEAVGRTRVRAGLPFRRLIAFSTLALPIAAAQVPLGLYLPAIYAQHFGISLAVLGTIFLAERLWGTLADPLIGVLSDRIESRFGRRKVWIAAGGVVFGVAGIALPTRSTVGSRSM